ncbi:MAG: flagellar biosynthesis protein FlhB [Phycisphaerae bacterium]|nr:flagellar biosynthesis protein FlhB [Phycisphaerae bacterium]
MPANDNKTEQPTPRRIEKAREEGQVPQSQEMLSAATLLALVGSTALLGPWFVKWSQNQIRDGLSCQTAVLENSQAFNAFINQKIIDVLLVISPFLLVLMVASIGANVLVSGLNFSTKALKLKTEQLNPMTGLKNLFSGENLVKLLFSILKLILIGTIVWIYLRKRIPTLAHLQWTPAGSLLGEIGGLILGVVLQITLGLAVIGIGDWLYHRWKHTERLKMSKQEVKDEHRDTEGAPEIKSKIRQKQYQAAMQRMLQDVPKANVVLVNPTHVAVALRYEPKTMQTPIVVAKGGDHMCEKIKEIARFNGVPIIRRPALARELHATVKLGEPIPEKLFTAVAEVLALLYRIRHRG